MIVIWKRTLLELGRVALAKLGHDPHGMDYRDRPWREAIAGTYRGHVCLVRGHRWRADGYRLAYVPGGRRHVERCACCGVERT